jgi:predicted DNA-binding antitoxin AbrB/MazE fold protein
MSLEVDATYENGMLRPDTPLPLAEHQRVKVTVHPQAGVVDRTYGLMGWTGDPDILRKIAEDDEFSVLESPLVAHMGS